MMKELKQMNFRFVLVNSFGSMVGKNPLLSYSTCEKQTGDLSEVRFTIG